jgi:L-2,4-diaminobutyric acid acetyltransferase
MGDVRLRTPTVSDGADLWRALSEAGLDRNSPYAYLLVATDFSETSLVAEDEGGMLGAVAAFRPPIRPEAVFVWQVGVLERGRGQGLASRMLHALIELPANRDARELTATVTPDNEASLRLFRGFARDLGVECKEEPRFLVEHFPAEAGAHEPEDELIIGPLPRDRDGP